WSPSGAPALRRPSRRRSRTRAPCPTRPPTSCG
ncbi:MAG: hypothetical protein AVDCRST_MAG11-760, partial [uncultured Gemmatimonadaceae bacterium]